MLDSLLAGAARWEGDGAVLIGSMAPRSLLHVSLALVLATTLVTGGLAAEAGFLAAVVAQTSPATQEALQLLEQGVTLFSNSQFDQAEAALLKALALYRQQGDRNGQWFALYFLGVVRTSIRDYSKGTEYLTESLKLAQALGDRGKQADALMTLGTAALSNGAFQQAIAFWQEAAAVAQMIPDPERQAKALDELILVHQQLGETATAQGYQRQRQMLQGTGALTPNEQYATALKQGQSLLQEGTTVALKQALQQFETAIRLAQQIGNPLMEATALISLATTYSQLGERRESITRNTQALEILRSQGAPAQFEATALMALGADYNRLGESQKALDFYRQSFQRLQQTGDRSGQSVVLSNMGNVYTDLGDYPQAMAHYQQALTLAQQTQDRVSEAKTLNNIGLVYSNLGQYQQALTFYGEAKARLRNLREPLLEATILNNQATVYVYLRQRQRALEDYERVLTLVKDAGNRTQEANTLANMATLYSFEDNPKKAIAFYQRALTLMQSLGNRTQEATILGNLGFTYAEAGQYEQAKHYQNQALALARSIGDRLSEGTALAGAGAVAYAQNNLRQALEHYHQSLSIHRQAGNRREETLSLKALGKIYFRQGNFAAAAQNLRAAIQIQESIRADLGGNDINKVSLFDEQAGTYRLLQQVLVAHGQPEAALEVAERARARAFVELLARRLKNQSQSRPLEALSVDQMRQVAKAQKVTLVQYSLLYQDDQPFPQDRDRQSPTQLLIWVIQPQGSIHFRQVDLVPWVGQNRPLSDWVKTARRDIGVRGIGVVGGSSPRAQPSRTDQLSQFYQVLIQPITDLLPQNPEERVVFVPQAELFLLPFAAMQDPQGRYLIERHTLTVTPSIQALALTAQSPNRGIRLPTSSALVVGNPTMPKVVLEVGQPPVQLAPLPGAEIEARAIADLLKTQPLIGASATRANVLKALPGAGIVHLATHGILDDLKDYGVPGAIALAPAGQDAGLLSADEILDLKLSASLVVLSACDTGRGKITEDGVIGLSRSFITAGVPSVIVSLWAVPDAPTAALMIQFYGNLQRTSDKAQALRQAMLETKQQYPDPRDWAAFTLMGGTE